MTNNSDLSYEELKQKLLQAEQRIVELETIDSAIENSMQLKVLIDNLPGVSYRCACD